MGFKNLPALRCIQTQKIPDINEKPAFPWKSGTEKQVGAFWKVTKKVAVTPPVSEQQQKTRFRLADALLSTIQKSIIGAPTIDFST